jgi:hypothetical protein
MFVIAPELLAVGSRRNNGRGVHCLDALKEAGGWWLGKIYLNKNTSKLNKNRAK